MNFDLLIPELLGKSWFLTQPMWRTFFPSLRLLVETRLLTG
jgi:hypothetical protein